MTADILTKALLRWKVATHVLGLRLCRASGGVLDSGTPGKPKAESDTVRHWAVWEAALHAARSRADPSHQVLGALWRV